MIRTEWCSPLAWTLYLVLVGNLATLLRTHELHGAALLVSIGAIGAAVLRMRQMSGGLGAIGIDGRDPLRGWLLGMTVGGLLGLGFAVVVFASSRVVERAFEYEGASGAGAGDLAVALLLVYPLQTAIPEEIAFRGLLLTVWQRALPNREALTFTGVAFALWHLVVAWETVSQVTDGFLRVGVYCLFLVALASSGIAFGVLRLRGPGIAAPVIAHWLVVIPVRVLLWSSSD